MKLVFLMLLVLTCPTILRAQMGPIGKTDAREIAEKFLACCGYSVWKVPAKQCEANSLNCGGEELPCGFVARRAFGYFSERGEGEKGWTIVFRTRGQLKSKITGVKVTMDEYGKEVTIEKTKVLLRLVDSRF